MRLFCSEPSAYIWEDDDGMVHTIRQGEGDEQGDPLMPLLFCVGQHSALEAIQRRLRQSERLLAYLDDVCLVSQPDRARDAHNVAEQELWTHAKIRIHAGKTHMWNKSGRMPEGCDELHRRAVLHDPTAQVWRGSDLPTREQGIKVLGCPLGHADFVTAQLETIARKHPVFWQAIPNVRDVQSAWLLLLHCAAARANFYLRVVRPDLVVQFARTHDASLWQCMCAILGIPVTLCDEMAKAQLYPLLLVEWDCVAQRGRGLLPIGRVGRTRCP